MTPNATQPRAGRPGALAALAVLAVGLAVYYYFAGEGSTLPLRLVPHLAPAPLVLDTVAAGPLRLPVPVSGFVVSLTHDVAGPFTQPVAAGLFLGLLAVVLVGWVAVASTLARLAFVAGMVPVIFFLMSLNAEALGVFNTGERYVLYVLLGVVGGAAFGLHAFAERLPLAGRALVMGALVAGLGGLLFGGSQYSVPETALQLAAYATPGGAVLVALLVLWVGIENVRALLWFNTQAEAPGSRFGLGPFVAASALYLAALLGYVWNGALALLPGLGLDPLVLLLPAVLAGGLGLRLRAPSYAAVLPYVGGAAVLFPLLTAGAAGVLAYAFATANTPLLVAARNFTALALLALGGGFLLYVLLNFAPLIRRRLRVYRVAFEPRRLPFYPVYVLGLGVLIMVQTRQGFTWPDQVLAGQYNHLGDLARQQSEAQPDDLGLALLAERYYAESGDVRYRFNAHAEFGRAALYRFRQQRRNEINALRRALRRGPSEKASLRLATLYSEPADLFEGLDVLRRGLQAQPRSAALAGDLAQLFTQTTLTDSVAYYLDRAERLAPGSYASQTNQLAFLLSQGLLPAADKLAATFRPNGGEPALASNRLLLALQRPPVPARPGGAPPAAAEFAAVGDLDAASFGHLHHAVLTEARRGRATLLPALVRLGARPANADYYEQLLFLQALARHALGQEQAARQLLGPLGAGSSAPARYYQHLLGLWQLQQGQYVTAAEQLDRAGVADSATRRAVRALAMGPAPEVNLLALAPVGRAWLAQARRAEQRGDSAAAGKSYQRIVREAPFNEPAIRAAAAFFGRRRDYPAAYEALRAGLDENPRSRALLEAYALAAADAGLSEYAAEALAQLRRRLPPGEYATLVARYADRQAARAAAGVSFSGSPAAGGPPHP